ncbi:unnamed protein product [Brugia pahangi]|uniref:SEC7 domain-containing protein n=1 Tax=Brugia pahangi TaxID=6280 RepID=A0A0N4SXL5_BRUPA|nr:unnamed protein product [Brugia pahangi]
MESYQCMSRINDRNDDDSIDGEFKHAIRAFRLSGRTNRLIEQTQTFAYYKKDHIDREIQKSKAQFTCAFARKLHGYERHAFSLETKGNHQIVDFGILISDLHMALY